MRKNSFKYGIGRPGKTGSCMRTDRAALCWPWIRGIRQPAEERISPDMKFKASMILVAVTVLFSPAALAAAGWTDYAKMAELVPTARHYYVFRLPVEKNPSGCQDKNWFYQNYDAIGADQMFDTLLEGIKAGLRLRVYVTGVCNLDGYSEISSVGIIP